ncbi:MAG TPA: hypothetical protein VFK41_07475 [Nocardioidaceae bacterium]|nr:hypothetical protein [Nocardioidaceae bacterium]
MVVDETLGMLTKAQKASVSLAAETLGFMVHTTKTGLTQPDELLVQMAAFLSAAGDVAGMAAQPLQTFIQRQQELADAMANLAELHSQLADVVATVARHHKGVVDALESLSNPLLAFAVKTEDVPHPAPPKKRAPAKKAAAKKR